MKKNLTAVCKVLTDKVHEGITRITLPAAPGPGEVHEVVGALCTHEAVLRDFRSWIAGGRVAKISILETPDSQLDLKDK